MSLEKLRQMSDLELGRLFLKNIDFYTLVSWATHFFILVIAYGQIAKRAGFTRWWSFALFVPVLGGLLPIVMALSSWPVEKRKSKGTGRRRRRAT